MIGRSWASIALAALAFSLPAVAMAGSVAEFRAVVTVDGVAAAGSGLHRADAWVVGFPKFLKDDRALRWNLSAESMTLWTQVERGVNVEASGHFYRHRPQGGAEYTPLRFGSVGVEWLKRTDHDSHWLAYPNYTSREPQAFEIRAPRDDAVLSAMEVTEWRVSGDAKSSSWSMGLGPATVNHEDYVLRRPSIEMRSSGSASSFVLQGSFFLEIFGETVRVKVPDRPPADHWSGWRTEDSVGLRPAIAAGEFERRVLRFELRNATVHVEPAGRAYQVNAPAWEVLQSGEFRFNNTVGRFDYAGRRTEVAGTVLEVNGTELALRSIIQPPLDGKPVMSAELLGTSDRVAIDGLPIEPSSQGPVEAPRVDPGASWPLIVTGGLAVGASAFLLWLGSRRAGRRASARPRRPLDPEACRRHLTRLVRKGKMAKAVRLADRWTAARGSTPAFVPLIGCIAALHQGDQSTALRFFRLALEHQPGLVREIQRTDLWTWVETQPSLLRLAALRQGGIAYA